MTVTKSQALDRFLKERVLGNRPFAWSTADVRCMYSHAYAGGCEIGQYLPENIATEADRIGQDVSNRRIVGWMGEAGFEDPRSDFWHYLQSAHDALAAIVSTTAPEVGSFRRDTLNRFEYYMRKLSGGL